MGSVRSFVVRGIFVASVAVFLASPSAWAQQSGPKSHTGEFVKAGQGDFRMTMGGQNEHAHQVNDQTRYTINGREASLQDLKPGDLIRVTTDNGKVLAVDATRPPQKPAQ